VIIYTYHHVRLLPPEPLVVKQPKCTQVDGADTVMQSSSGPRPLEETEPQSQKLSSQTELPDKKFAHEQVR
jgi:hypothetical protein